MAKKIKSAGWISKTVKPKRSTIPHKFQGDYITTPRIDHNKAYAYNMQRSKATYGPRHNMLHKPDNNFMEEIPETKSLSTYDKELDEYVRSERGNVVDTKHDLISHEAKSLYQLYLDAKKEGDGAGIYKRNWFSALELDGNIWLLFKGLEFMFIFICGDVEMISETYTNRDRAFAAYDNQKINWLLE